MKEKYRIVRVQKAGRHWYEIEERFLLFWWATYYNGYRKMTFVTIGQAMDFIKSDLAREVRTPVKACWVNENSSEG
jgi:hypothetical protein